MRFKLKGAVAALALASVIAGPASAELTGTLRIFFNDQNPAPKEAMEGMVERFGAMHPDLNIELTLIDARQTRPRSATI